MSYLNFSKLMRGKLLIELLIYASNYANPFLNV